MTDLKKILWGIFAVVIAVVVIVSIMTNNLEHIEDTNGAKDYSLTTITDENIINMDMGSIGGPNIRKSSISSDVEFSADKFTGVAEIFYDSFIAPSDFVIDLTAFSVTEGNFKMAVVHNGKIVATIEPDTFVNYRLDDVTGDIYLRIAGESAAFSFSMLKSDYDFHSHAE